MEMTKRINHTFCCIFLMLSFACTDKRESQIINVSQEEVADINRELMNAINNGDFESYNLVSNYYILEDKWPEFYFYSLIMANKYNCPEAHYHLYSFLTDKVYIDQVNMYSNDVITRKMSLYHLLKSFELGHEPSKQIVFDIYKKEKVPKARDVL
jgi:hypothetical protein